jgi:DNA-binding response OmpR family regulator
LKRLLQELCGDWGLAFSSSHDSETVLRIIENQPTDLVIIAFKLKSYSLDEWKLAGKLRARGFRMPILAVSEHELPGDRLRAFRHGIDEYLVKPVNVDRFHLYLDSHLKNTGKSNYPKDFPRPQEFRQYASEK